MKNFILGLLFLCVGSIAATAQPQKGGTHSHTHSHDSTTLANDTARVVFCYANNHTPIVNDTLSLEAYRFNPLAQQATPYLFLGNIGSPYTQLMYAPQVRSGLDMGLHQYDLYQPNQDNLRFYDAPLSFSEAFYTQAGNQEQGTLFTKLARSFGSHWSASFRYDIFNQKGVYQWQRPRHTHFSLALRYRSKNDKYQVFVSGIDNLAKAQQGGGYDLALLSTASGAQRGAIPSFNVAIDTQKRQSVQIAQFLKLAKGFELGHTIKYGYDRYVFEDRNPRNFGLSYPKEEDSTFYKFVYDSTGLKVFIENHSLTNTFVFQSPTDSIKRLRWSAGARHALWWTYQAPLDTVAYHNLFAVGSVYWQPIKRLNLNVDGAFGLAFRNAADYHINAKADLDLGKIGRLEGFFLSQRYAPNLLQNRLTVNDLTVWNNDFLPTYENTLGASYRIGLPFVALRGGVENHTLVNYIYHNTEQRPAQATDVLNIAQIKVDANFRLRNFHLDNKLIFQTMNTQAYLAMPSYWTRHSLYWQGKIFQKKMKLRGGLDVSLTDSYYAQGYNPLSGQFYVQNTEKLSFYPQIDAHVNFIIDKFNAFVVFENLYNVATGEVYQSAPNYAMRDFNFRFGIVWRFWD